LTDKPYEMYRKTMAINDDQILNYYLLGTSIPEAEIPSGSDISQNPMEVKKKLAGIIVSELHSKDEAKKAQEEFERVVQNKELPNVMEERAVAADRLIDEDLLVEFGLASSRSDAKRLFEQNGVSLDGERIKTGQTLIDEPGENLVLKVGKKMLKLKVNG
ncbi:MAG: hypothetical protein ACD_37C00671G0001, partial [uncultured bacterium]